MPSVESVYDAMVDAIFPVNQDSATYTQEGFYTWRIFGSPYMLLDDPPLGQVSNSGFLGEWYISQLRQSQILTLKIVVPKYTGNQKGVNVVDYVAGAARAVNEGKPVGEAVVDTTIAAVNMASTGLDQAQRNYIFYNQYEIYIQYVRLLIISMASYLGVMNFPIPSLTSSGTVSYKYVTIANTDWNTYTTAGAKPITVQDMFGNVIDGITDWFSPNTKQSMTSATNQNQDSTGSAPKSNSGTSSSSYYDIAGGPPAIVQFIIQPTYAVDSFGNTTTKSSAQAIADQSYTVGKEIAWLTNVGDTSSIAGAATNIVSAGTNVANAALENVR